MLRMLVGKVAVWALLFGMCGQGCQKEPQFEGKSINEWITLLGNQDLSVRERASEALARYGPEAVTYLRRYLAATDPALRRSVVVTLGKLGSSSTGVVPNLLKRIAREEVALIRAEILRALAHIDPKAPGVAEEFRKRLRDEDSHVRQAAQDGLEALKPPKKSEPESKKKTKGPKENVYQLREAVVAELEKEKVSFGLVAEVVRESRRAAVVWPGIKEGRLEGARQVAYIFEKAGKNQWKPVAAKIDISKGMEQLVEHLGGADKQRVIRPCGVPKEELAAFIEKHAKEFREAVQAKKSIEAMEAFEQLSKVFSFRMVAFTDILSQWLMEGVVGAAGWKLEPSKEPERFSIALRLKGKLRSGKVRLMECGDGYAIAEIEWNQDKSEER